MAKTVNAAFATFLNDTVNLDKDQTKIARGSRDWLLSQIRLFQNDETFPKSYGEKDIHFGSFARKTKTRPLDDIDLMICLSGQGSTYHEYGDRIEIKANLNTNLKNLCNDGTDILNSRKIINKFLAKLNDIPQYQNAEIKRNLQAAVLSLKSYDWAYDIVPCFFTAPIADGRTFYLIPDGKGNWMFTDPRKDRERTTTINQQHDGYVLNVIRSVKYWNKRPIMPSMSSSMLETMILDYYEKTTTEISKWVDIEFIRVLQYIRDNIWYEVKDPKNIQGNINSLSQEHKQKIADKANEHYQIAISARNYEKTENHKSAINEWIKIFGGNFPKYEA